MMDLGQVKATRVVQWVAKLADGRHVLRDGSPNQFDALPKGEVVEIQLWRSGVKVLSQTPPSGVDPASLIYRERITQSLQTNRVAALTYLVGWHPSGPYWAYDAATGRVFQSDQLKWGTELGMFDPIGESNG